MIKKRRLLGILACASILSTTSLTIVEGVNNNQTVLAAAKKKVSSRSYGVDVAVYQSSSVKADANAGAQFAIVKVSEGTSYRNPKAKAQISSAKANNMMPMAYHFALFGANSSAAVSEANYAVSSAKAYGLPKGSYIACDWEQGDGNNVNGGKNASANAIIAFMKQIKAKGYQPLLYSGASLLNNNINTSKVTAKFPNSLWVASYATMGRIDKPNFAYFPSMNGVAIWQFTDNWRGLNVDGNISLLPLSYGNSSSQAPKAKSIKNQKTVMHKAAIYNKSGQKTGKSIKANKKVTVVGGVVTINNKKFYQIGSNQYIKLTNVDGTPRTLKRNSYVYKKNGKKVKNMKLKKGAKVATYGKKKTIKGKKYYKINKNRYVKAANFK